MELTSEKLESSKISIANNVSAINDIYGAISSINCDLGAVKAKLNAASSALSSIAGGMSEASNIINSIISTYNEIEEKLSGTSSIESMTLEETESLLRSLDYSLPDLNKVYGYVKELGNKTINISKEKKYDIDLSKVFLTKKDAEDNINNIKKKLKAEAFKNVTLRPSGDAYLIIGENNQYIGWTNSEGIKQDKKYEYFSKDKKTGGLRYVAAYNNASENDAAEATIKENVEKFANIVNKTLHAEKKSESNNIKDDILGAFGKVKKGLGNSLDERKSKGPVLYSYADETVSENGVPNPKNSVSVNDMSTSPSKTSSSGVSNLSQTVSANGIKDNTINIVDKNVQKQPSEVTAPEIASRYHKEVKREELRNLSQAVYKDYAEEQKSKLDTGMPRFGADGLLVGEHTQAAQKVINRLYAEIPAHKNGVHSAQLDSMIDNLSTEECVWLLQKIENGGFGQTAAGYSSATHESHQNFLEQQVIKRYNGDIHELLKHWGTYSYSGY